MTTPSAAPVPPEQEEPEPLNFTGFLIRRAQQVHAMVWSEQVSAEITSVQFGVLAVLARRPGSSQRELCDELDLDRSTIAELVHRLERRGLLLRHRDADDKRRNRLWLSPAGEVELERLRPRVQLVERILTGGLSGGERDDLRRLLRVVLATAHPSASSG